MADRPVPTAAQAEAREALVRLLAACGRRDREAFEKLYRASSAKLFGVALRILKRDDWAEEVLQDCFVNIWNHAGSYDPAAAAPMTWMTAIVRNRCLDWLRRPRPEVVLQGADGDDADPLENIASGDEGPLELLARATESRAIAGCMGQLEGKQRQAVMLAFFDGMSHSELAAHMKQPLGTVKTWVRRALIQLKGCLGAAA